MSRFPIGHISARVMVETLFERDILLPRREVSGLLLPNEARVYQVIVDSALREVTQVADRAHREEALQWIEDYDGRAMLAARGYTYGVTFQEAIERGFVGLDAEGLSEQILKLVGGGALSHAQVRQYRAAGRTQGNRRMSV